MIVCDKCGNEIKNKSIQTKEENGLRKRYHVFCSNECLLVYYDKPNPLQDLVDKAKDIKIIQPKQEPTTNPIPAMTARDDKTWV